MLTRSLAPDEEALIARSPLFRALPPEALADFSAATRVVPLKKGEALFRQGDAATAVFVLLRGRVKVSETSVDGHTVVLRLEDAGAPLALLAALDADSSYPVTVEAAEPCLVARWTGARWHALLERHPQLALTLLPIVLARLRAVQDQCRELATERVERRVARVVLRLMRQAGVKTDEGVRVDAKLTRQELAEMAGTTLFTVSRLLSQWAGQGVLVSRARRLVVTKPHALVAIAEDLPTF